MSLEIRPDFYKGINNLMHKFNVWSDNFGTMVVSHDTANHTAVLEFKELRLTPPGQGQLQFEVAGIAGIDDITVYLDSGKVVVDIVPNAGFDQFKVVGKLINKIKQWDWELGFFSWEQPEAGFNLNDEQFALYGEGIGEQSQL